MSIPDWILTFQRSFFKRKILNLNTKCEWKIVLMSIRRFFSEDIPIKIPSSLKSLKKLQKTEVFVHKKCFFLVWKLGWKTMCITEIFALFPLQLSRPKVINETVLECKPQNCTSFLQFRPNSFFSSLLHVLLHACFVICIRYKCQPHTKKDFAFHP